MLAAFLLYGIGTGIATTAGPGPLLWIGGGLMLANSVAVVAIGALALPFLRRRAPVPAGIYLTTRIIEGALLAGGAVGLLVGNADANFVAYNTGMATLGLGSLFFCAALYRLRLVPRFLAAWGFAGYAAFAAGSILELLGVAGAGLYGAGPGGLFEVFFGVWLIARGFAEERVTLPAQHLREPVGNVSGPA
jgi:hypothetical protein